MRVIRIKGLVRIARLSWEFWRLIITKAGRTGLYVLQFLNISCRIYVGICSNEGP